MTNQPTTTCPKCFGTGRILAFAHVANGDCFGCGATGTVLASTTNNTAMAATAAGFRVIETDIGQLTINRFGAGFQAWHVDGLVWFDVVDGRIENVELSNGLEGKVPQSTMRSTLQRALRA